jgi:hypothetical protein
VQKTVQGGLSAIFVCILKVFFLGQENLMRGLALPVGDTGEAFMVQATLGADIMDHKAHKEVLEVKGTSGTLICFLCRNILKHDIGPDPFFKEFRSAMPKDFVRHTAASCRAAVDLLKARRHALTPSKFKDLQQALGIVRAMISPCVSICLSAFVQVRICSSNSSS